MNPYGTDLAHIHDVGFGEFARQAAPFLLDLLARSGIGAGLVVDLGCGSGIWARALVDAGYDVLGIDISPAMIRLARTRVPEAGFEVGSFTAFDPGACRAVTALGEPLAYLFDGANTRRSLLALCRRVYRALDRGGLFVFDLREPSTAARESYELTRRGDDWSVHCRAEEDTGRRLLTRNLDIRRRVRGVERRSREVHRLRLYRGTEIADELRRVGFRVRLRRSLGSLRLGPAHVALIARRP